MWVNVLLSIIIKRGKRFLLLVFYTTYLYIFFTLNFKLVSGYYDLKLKFVIHVHYRDESLKCMCPQNFIFKMCEFLVECKNSHILNTK